MERFIALRFSNHMLLSFCPLVVLFITATKHLVILRTTTFVFTPINLLKVSCYTSTTVERLRFFFMNPLGLFGGVLSTFYKKNFILMTIFTPSSYFVFQIISSERVQIENFSFAEKLVCHLYIFSSAKSCDITLFLNILVLGSFLP